MKLVFIIFYLSIFSSAQTINDKAILSYSTNKENLNKELIGIEKILIDDTLNAKVLEDYDVDVQIEQIKNFYTLTLKPIKSKILKRKLRFFLNQKYPNMFFISNSKAIPKKVKKLTQVKKTPALHIDIPKVESISLITILKKVGFEWLALLFLSLVGLLYSIYSRRKTILLNQTQDRLKENQSTVEEEFNQMEKMHG